MAHAHRIESGVAERQRQVALRRQPIVEPAAESVEAVAERRQRADDVAILVDRERPPEVVVRREDEGGTLDGIGHDRVDKVRQRELPAPTVIGVVTGQGHDHLAHGGPLAAEQPEDPRRASRRSDRAAAS